MTLPGFAPSPVKVIKNYVPFSDRFPLFKAIVNGPWHTLKLRYGTNAKRKNIVYCEGDPEAAYTYTKKATDKERPISYAEGPAELRALRKRLQDAYGFSFSFCYINYYRDEGTGIGWHNDAEEVGSQVPVRMVCLGGARTFSIWKVRRAKDGKLQKPLFAEWEELTEDGDLVEMPVGFHEEDAYRHAVLPQKAFAPARMSLTFRSPDLSFSIAVPKVGSRIAEIAPKLPQADGPRVFCCKAGHEYPKGAIYVGCKTTRGQAREGTIFGNALDPLQRRSKSNTWADEDEKEFRAYAKRKMLDPDFRACVENLRGQNLLCWCEQFCHARVWLELANNPEALDVAPMS